MRSGGDAVARPLSDRHHDGMDAPYVLRPDQGRCPEPGDVAVLTDSGDRFCSLRTGQEQP